MTGIFYGVGMNIDELTIGQAKDIASMFPPTILPYTRCESSENLDDFAIGQTVIIRTYSAGVWCGILERKAGNEVILKNARRMWFWKCNESISLSGVVNYGIDQNKSKIAPTVEKVWLEAIEIMPVTGEAMKSIMDAPNAKAE